MKEENDKMQFAGKLALSFAIVGLCFYMVDSKIISDGFSMFIMAMVGGGLVASLMGVEFSP